jgi:hypothetical protein
MLSEQFRWFPFNEHKGWTVLIAVAAAGLFMLMLLGWFATSLVLRRRFQFSRAPDVSGPVPQGNGPGDHVDDVAKPWPFGWPPYLGVKLRMRVNPRRNSYPDNAGHW